MIGKKTIFITGGTGLLGHYLIQTAPDEYKINCTVFPMEKTDYLKYDCGKYCIDIRDRDAVANVIRDTQPDYVIHSVALANVDYVEKNKEESRKVNLGGTLNVIKGCKEVNAKLIYISSNAVFSGENPPYSEEDALAPVNYYGKLKVKEESMVKESGLRYNIVRPILMYGWNLQIERNNPVTWLIELLKNNKPVNIVDDVYCNPLFTEDCCDVIWKIIMLDKDGVYHVAGEDEIDRYRFARITAEAFGLNRNLIRPVKSSFFTNIPLRPRNTTYCIDKIKKELNVFPCGVRKGLEVMRRSRI
jgi:dTDP-4-dehydrorhamnose reductase